MAPILVRPPPFPNSSIIAAVTPLLLFVLACQPLPLAAASRQTLPAKVASDQTGRVRRRTPVDALRVTGNTAAKPVNAASVTTAAGIRAFHSFIWSVSGLVV